MNLPVSTRRNYFTDPILFCSSIAKSLKRLHGRLLHRICVTLTLKVHRREKMWCCRCDANPLVAPQNKLRGRKERAPLRRGSRCWIRARVPLPRPCSVDFPRPSALQPYIWVYIARCFSAARKIARIIKILHTRSPLNIYRLYIVCVSSRE